MQWKATRKQMLSFFKGHVWVVFFQGFLGRTPFTFPRGHCRPNIHFLQRPCSTPTSEAASHRLLNARPENRVKTHRLFQIVAAQFPNLCLKLRPSQHRTLLLEKDPHTAGIVLGDLCPLQCHSDARFQGWVWRQVESTLQLLHLPKGLVGKQGRCPMRDPIYKKHCIMGAHQLQLVSLYVLLFFFLNHAPTQKQVPFRLATPKYRRDF